MDKLTKYTQVEHLQKTNELVDKVNELKSVATSGSYNDLTDTPEEITSASKEKAGIVKVGENINVDSAGTISVSKDNVTNALGYIPVNPEDIEEYTLPVANDITLGGVKIGSNINVAKDGTISLDENSVKGALGYTPLNADEGGTVNGDIDLVGGIYKINGEELESGINLLKRNKEYAAGDIAFSKSLNSQLHLKCIVAGTTAEAEPENLSSKVLNDEFTDGTVTWKVVKYTNQLENYVIIAKEDEIDESLLHENTIIIDPDEVMTPLDSSSYAMIGATDLKDGKSGFVPTPKAGDENKCLRGDGTWGTISSGINLLTRAKSYVYGDIAYSSHIPSWAYLYCVEAGTTAEVEPDLSSITTMGQLITDGTVQWIVDDVRFNYPVGLAFYDTYLHDGCTKLNGATVLRSDYKRLVKLANDKNLWTENPTNEPYYFGIGDGSTTMVLPDYRNRVIQGGDSSSVLQPGLPNITGDLIDLQVLGKSWTVRGAFKHGTDYNSEASTTGNTVGFNGPVYFNASLSNKIYGTSNTVQPASILLIPQFKI